jgi:hypothetical protein
MVALIDAAYRLAFPQLARQLDNGQRQENKAAPGGFSVMPMVADRPIRRRIPAACR